MFLNVLLIVADDLGVDKVGVYADDASAVYRAGADYLPETPVIDGLAEVGVRFTDAWANPVCSPTRAALFTGRHGFRTGVGDPVSSAQGTPLADEEVTLAEVLSEAGYQTGLFGKWHLGNRDLPESFAADEDWGDYIGESFAFTPTPLRQGWHRYMGTINGVLQELGTTDGGYYEWVVMDASSCEGCDSPEVAIWERDAYATTATVLDALSWIDEQTSPWFAAVALHAPHTPLELPPEACNHRAPGDRAPMTASGVYEEMVECVDQRLGTLLKNIDDLDNTLVIFVGDNGTFDGVTEGPFDDGRGKGTLYESGIRVPLIVADGEAVARTLEGWQPSRDLTPSAGITAGPMVVGEPVHVVDLFSTIAAVAGGDASTGVDGADLSPLLRGEPLAADRLMLAETFKSQGLGTVALRSGDWKVVVNVTPGGGGTCVSSTELYNLASDRFEQRDQSEAQPLIVSLLLAELAEQLDGVADPWLTLQEC